MNSISAFPFRVLLISGRIKDLEGFVVKVESHVGNRVVNEKLSLSLDGIHPLVGIVGFLVLSYFVESFVKIIAKVFAYIVFEDVTDSGVIQDVIEHFGNCVNVLFCCVGRRYSGQYNFVL